MKYSYVLFDADETLFRFDILAGMTRMFKAYNIEFTQADYIHYQKTNKQLWIDYQDGKISAIASKNASFSSLAGTPNFTAHSLKRVTCK